MEMLRKYQEEMPAIKNTETKMQNGFDGLISRLDMAEERINELKDRSIKTSQTIKKVKRQCQ